MTSSEQEKDLLIQIQLFQSKTVFEINVSAKFGKDQIKDEEAAPIIIGGPRDTENILVYWKNFTSGLSCKVSIFGQHYHQHLPIVKYVTIAPYNSKCSLLAQSRSCWGARWGEHGEVNMVELTCVEKSSTFNLSGSHF